MAEDHSKMKDDILLICETCLKLKDEIMRKNQGAFQCYVGGGRQMHPSDENPYARTIYLGRDSKRYDHVPEDVIDLNEVYALYKREKKLSDWEDHPFHSSFDEAIHELKQEGRFLILELQDIIQNSFEGTPYDPSWESQKENGESTPDKYMRFVRLA